MSATPHTAVLVEPADDSAHQAKTALETHAAEAELTHAYAEGRKDEREDCVRLLSWAYSKLAYRSFDSQEDALALDEIKLILMGAA